MARALRLALQCSTLTLAFGGHAIAHRSLEDFSALVQRPTAPPAARPELDREASLKARFPDLDKILDQVKESMQEITEQVGDIVDEATQTADEFEERASNITSEVGKKIAKALNKVLVLVKGEADRLLEATMEEKTKFFEKLNHSLEVGNETILRDFESAANKVITESWGRWQTFRLLVDRSAQNVELGLEAAGQERLAKQLHVMVQSTLNSLDDFTKRLRYADEDLHGLDQRGLEEAQDALFKVNDDLNEALQHVVAFIAKYQQIFQELIDRISNVLIASNEEIDSAFASVQQNVTSVAWRVRSSGRELILGMHQAIVSVAEAKGMPAPKWRPVSIPPASSIDWGAATGANHLPVLAALIAVLAVVH